MCAIFGSVASNIENVHAAVVPAHNISLSARSSTLLIGCSNLKQDNINDTTGCPSPFEVESAIAKLKRYKSPGSDQILAELIQAGGEILRSKIHNLITSIWHTEKLPDQWKESIIVPIHKKGDKTDCSNYWRISLLSTSYKILSNILLPRLSPYIQGGSNMTGTDFFF
jgi:hypothetical protein